MEWVIYVAESTASNFKLGVREGVWGHKKIFKTVNTDRVKRGDILYFVHHLTFMRDKNGQVIKGAPRVPVEYYKGSIASLTKARVTKSYYQDTSLIWSDDIYPHRYQFEVIETHENLPFGDDFFSEEFVQAVHTSTMRKGLAIDLRNAVENIYAPTDAIDLEVFEGTPVYRRHVVREREQAVVLAKKREVKAATGKLTCEACNFNFEATYGERGEDYIECHHKNPLADSNGQKTKLEDLALLCSNCHRVIHRSKPWISVEKLRKIIDERT